MNAVVNFYGSNIVLPKNINGNIWQRLATQNMCSTFVRPVEKNINKDNNTANIAHLFGLLIVICFP